MTVDLRATDVAAAVRVLGEPVRWSIVERLAHEDLCVCHLVEDLQRAQPLISHHLRVLRDAGLVRAERQGAFTYYVLERDVLSSAAARLLDLGRPPRAPRRRPCA